MSSFLVMIRSGMFHTAGLKGNSGMQFLMAPSLDFHYLSEINKKESKGIALKTRLRAYIESV